MPNVLVALANPLMEDPFKNTFNFLKSEKLSANERIQMKNVLLSVMNENPVQATSTVVPRYEHILSYFDSGTLRPVGFAFALVLVVGVGTSYAAGTALPGDPLYAVKVGFTEPIQGVLNVSPVAQAEWDTELLSRRLEEAATLAAHGNLNDSARNAIETQIAINADNVNKSVNRLKSSDEGAVAAASVESGLEASLVGHERVLTGLSVDLPKQAQSIAPLLHKVREQAEATNSKRKASEQSLSGRSESTMRAAASNQQRNARNKIREIRTLTAGSQLQASTTIEASSSAKAIEDAIESAESKFNEGKYTEALNTFQATIRAAKAVEVNLNAESRLSDDIQGNSDD
ncbi:MAG: hypothetical protein KBD06_02765 [Candidatus Pacebacteria bacterium]|nr:hypothetical protein [Candidatus Paceibacterota bacterium]